MWLSEVVLPGAPGTQMFLPGDYSLLALVFPKTLLALYFQKYGPKSVIFEPAPKTCASFRELLQTGPAHCRRRTFSELL